MGFEKLELMNVFFVQPIIIGSNSNEGAGFVTFSEDGPGEAVLFATTQSIIACPVAQEVRYVTIALFYHLHRTF